MSTIKDIARETGLSLATISKYLNGGHVLDQNRERIEAAITKLGYKVNYFARGLKTNRSMTVGVLLPTLRYFSPSPRAGPPSCATSFPPCSPVPAWAFWAGISTACPLEGSCARPCSFWRGLPPNLPLPGSTVPLRGR